MKHVFVILLCLTALGCITFVGWQFAQPALTGSAETTYVDGDIVPNFESVKAPEQLLQERRELAKEVFNPFPEYFTTKQEYDTEMKDWLTYNNEPE